MRRMARIWILAACLTSSFGATALADGGERGADSSDFAARLERAQKSESRPEADKARDANRLPAATLAFFGIESDMRVLELVPGGGWYTRLLAPALDGTGQLYLAFGTERLPEGFLESPEMKNVRVIAKQSGLVPTDRRGVFEVPAFEFEVQDLDAVLTFRNLHNLTPTARANLNRAVFDALRSGGIYGVIDHTRRHMQPDEGWNQRRLDPVLVIEEIQAAGFVLEDASPLHRRPKDALDKEVGDPSVTGQTDRFTLKFRKP